MKITSPSNPTKRVTIRDVAQKAGVALTTVSSALNGTGRISPSQRERIHQIARECGYRRQIAAQLLRSHASGYVGLVIPLEDRHNVQAALLVGHASPILCEFIARCEEMELRNHVEFMQLSADPEIPRQLAGGLVDGVLIEGFVGESLREQLDRGGYVWVSIDEPARHCVLSATDDGIWNAAQHLAAIGHRRIAFIGGPRKYEMHRLAREGFERAVEDFGLQGSESRDWVHSWDMKPNLVITKLAAEWASRILRGPKPPTAIICADLSMACGVIYQATSMGIQIPADLSIVGVGIAADAERLLPRVSTVEIDFKSMVKEGIAMLQGCLQGRRTDAETIRIPPRMVMRETVAPVRAT